MFKNGSPNPTFQNQKPKSLKIGWLEVKWVPSMCLIIKGLQETPLRELFAYVL